MRCSCRWGTYKRTFLSMNNPGQVIINFPFRPNYKSTCMFSTPQIHLTVALPNFRLELHCFLAGICQRSRNHTSEAYNGLTDLTNKWTRAKNDRQYLKSFHFRSTPAKTSDEKIFRKILITPKVSSLNFTGSRLSYF